MQDKQSNITEAIQNITQNENILIQELYEHGSHTAKQKNKYSVKVMKGKQK